MCSADVGWWKPQQDDVRSSGGSRNGTKNLRYVKDTQTISRTIWPKLLLQQRFGEKQLCTQWHFIKDAYIPQSCSWGYVAHLCKTTLRSKVSPQTTTKNPIETAHTRVAKAKLLLAHQRVVVSYHSKTISLWLASVCQASHWQPPWQTVLLSVLSRMYRTSLTNTTAKHRLATCSCAVCALLKTTSVPHLCMPLEN